MGIRHCVVMGLMAAIACTGNIGEMDPGPMGPGSGPGGPGGPGPGPGPMVEPDCEPDVPATPLRRLTSEEMNNTLADLVGADVYESVREVVYRFPSESIGGGDLEGFQDQHIEVHVSAMFDVGAAVADAMRADTTSFDRLGHGCMGGAPDATCVGAFVAEFGKRAFRRPLTNDEVSSLANDYISEGDHDDAFALLMMRLLSSPDFLFHMELEGDEVEAGEDALLDLSDYAVASRLSYRLLRTMPTPSLFAAADAGELSTNEQVQAAAAELMDDPRARDSVWRFFEQWLELDHPLRTDANPALLGDIDNSGLDQALVAEVRAFVEALVWDEDASVAELFSSNLAPAVDERVASIYGVPAWDGSGPIPTTDNRAGIALRAAMIQSSTLATGPIFRGVFVLQRYLCDELPSPDLDIVNSRLGDLEELDRETMRSREIIDAMTGDAPCSACHNRINPIAFAMEDFDALGRHRDVEEAIVGTEVVASFPVDEAGVEVEFDRDAPVVVDRGSDLSGALAGSQAVHDCLVERLMVHTQGRLAGANDMCSLFHQGQAAGEGMSLRELYLQSVLQSAVGQRLLETE